MWLASVSSFVFTMVRAIGNHLVTLPVCFGNHLVVEVQWIAITILHYCSTFRISKHEKFQCRFIHFVNTPRNSVGVIHEFHAVQYCSSHVSQPSMKLIRVNTINRLNATITMRVPMYRKALYIIDPPIALSDTADQTLHLQ